MKLAAIAQHIDGQLQGDGEIEIAGVAGVQEAGDGDITYLGDPAFRKQLDTCPAAAVIVKDFLPELARPQIRVKNPRLAFAQLLTLFHVRPHPVLGVRAGAHVDPAARIGADVSIYPGAYVAADAVIGERCVLYPGVFVGQGSQLGADCVIHPNAVIRENVCLGARCIVHAGAVIGGDGFGYVFTGESMYKIPHVGRVVLEDDVEIGCNACIDRGTTGDTVIGRGSKIDNLVQIAHNVRVGRCSALVSQVGVAGSSTIGDYVLLGGQVGVADHTEIESGTILAARSGIMGRLPKGNYAGAPAIPQRQWLKAQALFARLPELKKRLDELEAVVKKLGGGG